MAALAVFYTWSYFDCLRAFFFLDDFWIIRATAGIEIHTPLDLLQFFRPVPPPSFLLYRPITTVVYFFLLRTLFDYHPVLCHATQLAFHVMNAVLVLGITWRVVRSLPLAVAAAFIYATAPGHALAVYWIAVFNMTGTAFFYLLALWLWLAPNGSRRVGSVFVVFIITLLAGEHAVTLPIVLTLTDLLLAPQRNWRRLCREQAPFYVVAGAYATAKIYYARYMLPIPVAAAVSTFYRTTHDPSVILQSLGRYLGFGLDVAYALHDADVWPLVVGAALLLAAVASTIVVLSVKAAPRPVRVIALGLDVFLVTLGPVLILQDHQQPYYIGIASVGLSLAVAGLLSSVPLRHGTAAAMVIALVLSVHVFYIRPLQQQPQIFQLFVGGSETSAGWLYALANAATDGVSEVVIPENAVTKSVFELNEAHRFLLCAPYTVRLSANILTEAPAPGRLIIPTVTLPRNLPRASRSWASLRRNCRTQRTVPDA